MDPMDGPVAAFAVELRKLREQAGTPPYRVMAARAHFAASTLAQAATGERLPTLPVTLAYVGACGGDEREWRARWEETLAADRERGAVAAACERVPYLGLAGFEEADRDYFFGRSALVERLAGMVKAHRMVMVVGPSGCGKSSLLRAGLVPALRPRAARVLTPGVHPALPAAAELVVVDQFEEVFTLCEDPAERGAFIDALVAAGGGVVLSVRADFFGRCADHPRLIEAVEDSTILVGPMSPAELRQAIVKPAATAGLIVQRELTARIVEEVTGQPGGLPLMSHALLETWKRHHGKALTLAAYEAVGGIAGAVARTSEELHADLTPAQQDRLRHLLLRLVMPGEAGAQPTRRPVRRSELLTGDPGDPGPLLLERLTAARLVTQDGDTVNLAHEALLTAWPRLRAWAEEDRERLRVHRRLTEAADTWEEHGRDPGALYRGLRLELAREHLTARTLTPPERAFLAASDGERRKGRRRTAVLAVLAVVLLVTTSLIWQRSLVNGRQKRELHARRVADTAETLPLTNPSLAMRLSLAAWKLADLPETRAALRTASLQPQQDVFADPDTSPDTRRSLSADGRSLISATATRVTRWDLRTHQPQVNGAPVQSDVGAPPLVCSPGEPLRLPDPATGRPATPRWAPTPTAEQCREGRLRLSPDGRVLLMATPALVRVWDVAAGTEAAALNAPGVREIGFSADGAFVATAGEDELQVRATNHLQGVLLRQPLHGDLVDDLWIDPDAGEIRYLTGPTVQTLRVGSVFTRDWREERATSAAFSPDGKRLVLTYRDRVELRDGRTGEELPGPPRLSCPTPCWMEAALSPDGRTLAYGDAYAASFTATLWDLADRRITGQSPPSRHGGPLAFAQRGELLLISGASVAEEALTSWDTRTGAVTTTPGVTGSGIAVAPRGGRLLTTRGDVASLPPLRRAGGGPGPAQALAFSPDGRFLAAGDTRGRTALWDGDLRSNLGTLPPAVSGAVTALAFSPDAGLLAVGTETGIVQLWDTAGRRPVGPPLATPGGAVLALSLSGDALSVAGKHLPFQRYDLSAAGAASTVCRRVGHGLGQEEWATYFPDFSYQPTCEAEDR
ncbi:DNA-binding protein [Nonomuraea sp. WAC 01424]|nr:DNA-binding protein [Nonomuraea sp. WAC 01424]